MVDRLGRAHHANGATTPVVMASPDRTPNRRQSFHELCVPGRLIMLDRRSFMAATAAAVVAPNVTDAKECTKSYDWETM
jgi:hypothetical protein